MYIKLYADMMLLYNFIMIYIVLTITDIIGRIQGNIKKRLILSLLFSVVYVVLISINISKALENSYIFIIMLTILYSIPCNIFALLKNYVVITLSNCIVYGFITYSCNIFGNAAIIITIISSSILCIILKVIFSINFKKIYNITIYNSHKSVRLKALFDSGNLLTDSITGKPVIIAQKDSIKPIIPQNLRELSYKSLGNDNGTMNVFTAKEAVINRRVIKYPVIAIYNTNLSSNGDYNAIIGLKHLGG